MAYHPNIHHRKSIRLKGYDYSQAGLYFITICVQDRECLFGNIENGEMILNDAGQMVEKWYYELGNKYPDIKCHEMMVMPNHFHCIFENIGTVGADLRVCPDTNTNEPSHRIAPTGEPSILNGQSHRIALTGEPQISGEHIGSPLHRVIQWLKTMSTNEYIRGVKQLGWQPFNGKLWQRNYWEHIIRNEQSYQRISEYIINNPKNWNNDKLYNK
jgi:REP element-mobilizing transposase RayT